MRLIAASLENWPEITCIIAGEEMLGADGLIRVALWSASQVSAALMLARRAMLLVEDDKVLQIRCKLLACTPLALQQPLTGFLLRPIGIMDERASKNGLRSARKSNDKSTSNADAVHAALFQAFPVHEDGEYVPPG